MFEKLNLNWHAVWRKAVAGSLFAALMGYTYKLNQKFDAAVDAEYPKPRSEVDEEEAPAS